VLVWSSAAGRQYSIARATNLLACVTNMIASGIPATAPLNAFTDTVTTAGTLLYRVRVE
jgi:hypothetical protein